VSRRGLVALLALAFTACSDASAEVEAVATPSDPAPRTIPTTDRYAEFRAVLARHQAMSDRVSRISRRLRVANAPLCDVTRLDVGLSTHQLTDYPPSIRPLALHFMDISENGRFIRSIVPGSPADRARLRRGEEVISGWPVQSETPLVIDDGNGAAAIRISADQACVAPAFVINADAPNASTDGREIELSTALVLQVGDDSALALIIAHEMAHVLRGHSAEDGLRWNAELQADADALTLMRNAGYDIDGTVAAWEAGVEAHRDSQAMSATHPPLEIRLRNLESALAALKSGPSGFRPLAD